MTENKIGFGVMGPLLMTVDGAPVPLGTPKQRAVLAVLVMNRNRPVGFDCVHYRPADTARGRRR